MAPIYRDPGGREAGEAPTAANRRSMSCSRHSEYFAQFGVAYASDLSTHCDSFAVAGGARCLDRGGDLRSAKTSAGSDRRRRVGPWGYTSRLGTLEKRGPIERCRIPGNCGKVEEFGPRPGKSGSEMKLINWSPCS